MSRVWGWKEKALNLLFVKCMGHFVGIVPIGVFIDLIFLPSNINAVRKEQVPPQSSFITFIT